jgi:hypothetical protein
MHNNIGDINRSELKLEAKQFNIEFRWKNIKTKITFENGQDLIKASMLLSEFLSSNGIPNKLEITSNNQ